MNDLIVYENGEYKTPSRSISLAGRIFPTLTFYRKFGWNVFQSSRKAQRGVYDSAEWSRTSYKVLEALESVGVRTEINGIDQVRNLDGPCVFVGNHMSMLETIVLPAIIQPVRDVTFVVKQSLMDYPVFKHIVRSRDPIAVSRDNPREDFKAVMKGGMDRLKAGVSIVVFPQTTRASTFDPSQFNTIGVKLALRAGVPVVPIALATDAWGNGKLIKDLGPIDKGKRVRFEFGAPIQIEGRGDKQHQEIVDFIQSKLDAWKGDDRESFVGN